jgi:hypothetical protein
VARRMPAVAEVARRMPAVALGLVPGRGTDMEGIQS